TPQRTWSVAKSIAATLVGAAVFSGEYAVSDAIGLDYWRAGGEGDPRNAITIDHALRMATGRYSDTPGNRTDPLYWGGTTVDERAVNWPPIHRPGTVYRYANNDTLMAVKAIDGFLARNPPHEFFAKLGMENTVAETDNRGNHVLSSQVWSTAGDLATLGELYLADGVWRGERLLPEGWRDYVSNPAGPQPEGTEWGYGAGWWTFRRPDGNAFAGIPDDAFAARGNRGQYLVVVPSRNVVIVRRGEDRAGTRFDIAAFTRDVLEALEGE
ncbi:MAG: serine hydrolase, partial [Erythrobacter sp.]|nr:serine hydrolase [Erythrobacter sp.]